MVKLAEVGRTPKANTCVALVYVCFGPIADIVPQIEVPEEQLIDLRRRINATRFPERETVTDSEHSAVQSRCPLYPQKQTSALHKSMPSKDHKRTQADISSFDHCIRTSEQ
jgi:hypothetical protein